MKQTAVEWLEKSIKLYVIRGDLHKEFEKAKEMEKQQIIEAFWNGDNTDCLSEQNSREFAEKYYNETFKNE